MARKKKEEAASGSKMTLAERMAHYKASGRTELTPRQLRRAAHKAKISTGEVQAQSRKA